jgi:signal transduction histidine kinase
MIGFLKKDRTSRLRALRIYLLIILICNLVLFSLGSIAFSEQRTLVSLSSHNLISEFSIPADSDLLAASRKLWLIGFALLVLLAALIIEIFLLLRVTWEIRFFQIRSDFVSGVSHEFKTPLSLIRLYSETLANDEDDYFSVEDRRNYIRIIARESERLSRLIDNVLDFSRMEKRHTHYELQEGDLTPVVAQAISDYSDYLTWRGFEIRSSFWPQLPPVRFQS